MASFSAKERFLASLLSATPGLKSAVKKAYVYFNAMLYKKAYKYKITDSRISAIEDPIEHFENQLESFFGYYDKCPLRNKLLISHVSSYSTRNLPSEKQKIGIAITNLDTNSTKIVTETKTYTWQQGARTQWLSEDLFIYNDLDEQKNIYVSQVYSVSQAAVINTFDFPVQDSFGTNYFLSINYSRLMELRPDYGYRNLPRLTKTKMADYDNDGIWFVNYETKESHLIHSLSQILTFESKDIFGSCEHKVNHVMISKDGKGFIFIHRFYQGKRRFDRLMYSDFKSLKVLVDYGMVSHCCWIDDENIFGYFRVSGSDGYYYCNIRTNEITECKEMTNLRLGDGHPSCFEDKIVFDSYPDKSRMQRLFVFNKKTLQVSELVNVFQSIKYMGETRCDLHPRFSDDGNYIFFDTVYKGLRRQCYINIKDLSL